MRCEKIDINQYEIYVFDVDGTLYYQNRLRFEMAKRLVLFYLRNPFKLSDLFIIYKFRKLREYSDTTEGIYRQLSIQFKKSEKYIEELIDFWIYENPLSAIEKTKDSDIISLIEKISANNKKVVIWSDYKADDKLKKLSICADGIYTADDESVGELKPSPKALELIKNDYNVETGMILMIGDRDVKDGEAARRVGIDYVILPKSSKSRKKIYS